MLPPFIMKCVAIQGRFNFLVQGKLNGVKFFATNRIFETFICE
jgi:hypothetical protein